MIVLVGFMGAGKSTVGRKLAAAIGVGFVDSDVAIEQRAGVPIPEIFSADGEKGFRGIESEVVSEILTRTEPCIVALGGGALGDAATRDLLSAHTVVYLDVDLDVALARISSTDRPMLGRGRVEQLFAEREPVYREVAELHIPVGDRSAEEIATELAAHPSIGALR